MALKLTVVFTGSVGLTGLYVNLPPRIWLNTDCIGYEHKETQSGKIVNFAASSILELLQLPKTRTYPWNITFKLFRGFLERCLSETRYLSNINKCFSKTTFTRHFISSPETLWGVNVRDLYRQAEDLLWRKYLIF